MIRAGLSDYAPIVGAEVIGQLERLAERLGPRALVHINSTRSGGGVAEILHRAVPLLQQLGLETSWEIIQGDPFFFAITKTMHNGLQGEKVNFTQAMMDHYLEVNRENARSFKWNAEFVLLHDPPPAPLIREMRPQGKYWIWRCHIDASRPNFQVWRFLREIVSEYDASVFSMSQFAQDLPHPQYLIRPSIDPLSQKT